MFKVLKDIFSAMAANRHQIVQIAIAKQRKNYTGSDLGMVWAYVKPAMYVCAFYIAICIGFKSSKDVSGIHTPYFVWLTIGLVAWFYMRDMILGGASCFNKNRMLILKLGFPPEAIPAIPAISNLLVHGVLMVAAIILTLCFGVMPSIYWLQLPFYTILMVIFAVIWSFLAGCLSVLSKDFFNMLKSISTMIFWLSGILFDPARKGGDLVAWFFRFNPITFITEGYRNTFCKDIWFFEEPLKLGCYLITMVVFFITGLLLFKRIQKDIPDVV